MKRIKSRDNPLVRRLSRLAGDKKYRRAQGEMVCEGEKLLHEALRSGVRVHDVLLAEERSFDGELLARARESGARLTAAPERLVCGLSQVEAPQGLIFCCARPVRGAESLRGAGRLLLLDGVQDPGNLGTILRTADAFALYGVVLCEGCADPTAPKVIRATMGAIFRLPVAAAPLREAAELARALELPLYAAALEPGSVPASQAALRRSAVIIGSEGHGVTPQALALCDQTVIIPMAGGAESLNASVAASIFMYEMVRGDLQGGERP